MENKPLDINAREALNQMKMEIAKEMGVSNSFNNNVDSINNIFAIIFCPHIMRVFKFICYNIIIKF